MVAWQDGLGWLMMRGCGYTTLLVSLFYCVLELACSSCDGATSQIGHLPGYMCRCPARRNWSVVAVKHLAKLAQVEIESPLLPPPLEPHAGGSVDGELKVPPGSLTDSYSLESGHGLQQDHWLLEAAQEYISTAQGQMLVVLAPEANGYSVDHPYGCVVMNSPTRGILGVYISFHRRSWVASALGVFELLAMLEADLLPLVVFLTVGSTLARYHVWSLRC